MRRNILIVSLFIGACTIFVFCCVGKKPLKVKLIEKHEKMDDSSRYIINGDEVSKKRFEVELGDLIVDERSHFCYETSTGGVSGYRGRHRSTGSNVTYQAEMVDEVTVFKLTKSPDTHKDDTNHLKRYNEALISGDVFDVWLDMLKAWGEANHLIPILNGDPLFEESIRVISGYHGLQKHSQSLQILESAVKVSSYSYDPDPLPLFMLQTKKPLAQITPDELATIYSALGRWTFINEGFSPD